MAETDRLRIAVFIDFDNIEIGVKNTLGSSFDAGLVLDALKERGEVLSKMAYSDWQRAGTYSRLLTQHAIRMVQRNLTPGGDKNGADINLALDALEMAFTHSHINAFVIVGGDSDFISLVEKLKQYGKKVFIVGGRQFTSGILQRNCHEFIAYENLTSTTGTPSATPGARRQPARDRMPIEQAVPQVTRALQVLSEREVSPQLGLLKSTLLQLDSTFSERTYGAGSFRDFVQKLEKAGVVKVHHGKGGLLVELADSGTLSPSPAPEKPVGLDEAETPAQSEPPSAETGNSAPAPAASRQAQAPGPPPATIGTAADGLRELKRILAAAVVRRWPMYLRNVKQILRQTDATFDERAYGFGNLTDLLRAAHREGIVRVDRDRQGVIRVFQGGAAATPAQPVVESVDAEEEPIANEDVAVAAAAAEIGVPVMPVEPIEESEPPIEAEEVLSVDTARAPVKRKRPRSKGPARNDSSRPRRTRKAS